MSRHQQRQTSFQKKTARKERRTERRRGNDEQIPANDTGYGKVVKISSRGLKPIVTLNDNQGLLLAYIRSYTLTIATGCAGTGKTHIALAEGIAGVISGLYDKLVLTKPDFEIDSKMGTLPGGPEEKTALLFRPMREVLIKLLGSASHLENLEKNQKVMFEPLGNILGLTFDRSFMIMDEAQCSTPGQMKAFLTRVGKNSKIVLCGDYADQKFVAGRCGLEDALKRFGNNPNVGTVEFDPDDIIRSDFCKDVILGYRQNLDDTPDQ